MMPRLFTTAWIVGFLWLSGCNYPLIRSQNPEEEDLTYLADMEPEEDIVELIGQSTVPMGLKPLKIQGVRWSMGWRTRAATRGLPRIRTRSSAKCSRTMSRIRRSCWNR